MMKTWQLVLFGIFLGLAAAAVILLIAAPPQSNPIILEPVSTQKPLSAYITGAVKQPGVYSLAPGSRLQDLLNQAGGATADADLQAVNLAMPLKDGERYYFPAMGQTFNPTTESQSAKIAIYSSANPLNINLASLDELQQLPGIGPSRAQDIIDYREKYGPFKKIEDIMNVSGIGPAMFNEFKDSITVTVEPAPTNSGGTNGN
jgi:competence protein ComEA